MKGKNRPSCAAAPAGGRNSVLSATARPAGMSVKEWQTALRRQAAERTAFAVGSVSDSWAPGQYTVTSPVSRRVYRVMYYGPGCGLNHCECMDFRTNSLGTCKHIEAVALAAKGNPAMAQAPLPAVSSLYMSYVGGRHLKLRIAPGAPDGLAVLAMRYFDDDNNATAGMVPELPAFIEHARKIEPRFHCYPDALNYILEERDRVRREAAADALTDEEVASALAMPLLPYQMEGVRFAFRAGRVLIADEMGLGKTVQALGTAELMRRRNMVSSVLVICPTSLKYQWKKEIERFALAQATVVEGPHSTRRDLYFADAPYRIVSYHTLANDIKAMGPLTFDMVMMDEVQRLKNWNTQISQAARRVESDYCVVLSGTPLENRLDELYSVMQFVDQYALGPYHEFVERHIETGDTGRHTGYRRLGEIKKALAGCMLRRRRSEVASQLPPRTDKTLFVPVTREQRDIHDQCQSAVAQLVYKWKRHRYLSEKDRKRLLLLLSRMRMVCDSTFVLDQKTRSDTKPAEALQLVLSMIESGDRKAVIFSQWERMTRVMAEEFDRAGIKYEYLHGGISAARRRDLVENFSSDADTRVFLSTDAGATGLNLQSGSLLINLDMPWNPAVLEQRISRIYRLGQERDIQVINMVAAGTIEERMLATLSFKSGLAAGVLDGGDDRVTLDDSTLSRVADVVARLIPPPEAETALLAAPPSGTGADCDATDSIADATEAPDTPDAISPDLSALIARGSEFLAGLAATLRDPAATDRLVDALVHTDQRTGRSELRIPVESRAAVADIINAFARFFK